MSYARLDSVLHYVEIPQAITRTGGLTGQTKFQDCVGRNDHEEVFKWLKENKVKHIIHLRVYDIEHPSHSCESIENALCDLNVVKVWDWAKLDIDSETLLKAAPNIKELVLYWSGSNIVLRGWSEPAGLKKLRFLERITIHAFPVSV